MKKKSLLIITTFVVCMSLGVYACWLAYPAYVVHRFIRQNSPSELRSYASEVQKNEQAGKPHNEDQVPESFRRSGALEVRTYMDDIMIILYVRERTEYGVLISLTDIEPDEGSGIEFTKVDDGIFSFEQKMREEYVR